MIKYVSCISIILLSATASVAQDIHQISFRLEEFKSNVSGRGDREKKLTLSAVRFGLECSKDFMQKMTSDTGENITTTLRANHIPKDLFANKVIEVCRSAAYRNKSISRNHWDEVESKFLKDAVLFSLLKEPY